MIPRHCANFSCCACFGIKNTNVPTGFDQIHQLFHKILSVNIILKSIKGHNSVEKLGKINSLFLKILRKNEILTSIKGHDSLEKFGKISFVGHTNFH